MARTERKQLVLKGLLGFGLALLAVLLTGALAQAKRGDLDRSFGGDGKVRTKFHEGHDAAASVAVDSRGRIVAAGSTSNGGFALARYRQNGHLDRSFSGNGKVRTDLGGGARAVAIDSQGRIVAGGQGGVGGIALARYKANGRLDPSFGGGGTVTTDLGCGAVSVAIDSQGRIAAGGGCHFDFTLTRFNPDGGLDGSFGASGTVTTDFGGSDADYSVAIDSRDRIVAAGGTSDPNSDFALARYNQNGSLDASFAGGKVTTSFGSPFDSAESVAIDSRDRVVAAGSTGRGSGNADFALARYNPSGSLNNLFGPGGKVTTSFGRGGLDFAHSVAIDSRGRIVAAGGYGDFELARYHPNGTPDRSFSGNGKVTTRGRGWASASSVMIDSRDRIVAAGSGSGHFALARYIGYRRR
jgi:uncharacterized delta-60 repeat protein